MALNDAREVPMATGSNAWIADELAGCHFADARLGRRLSTLLDQMARAMGDSIPLACQEWANTKAAYQFFIHDRVSEADSHRRNCTKWRLFRILIAPETARPSA